MDLIASGKTTTVMLRNIPNRYTQSMFFGLLNGRGFDGLYDFAYLPMGFRSGMNLGYACVNFLNHKDALYCMNVSQGCGVVCCVLLCGYLPFHSDRDEDALRCVRTGKFQFRSVVFDEVGVATYMQQILGAMPYLYGKVFVQHDITKLIERSTTIPTKKAQASICRRTSSRMGTAGWS